MDQLFGYIERITFQNQDTGFTVAQLTVQGNSEPICIVGTMLLIQPGETVRCFGEWKSHLVYGRQFMVKEIRREAPADIIGIRKYLGSGLIKGIGQAYAGRIVDAFGADTLNIIDQNPGRLEEVAGLGPKRIESIKSCWEAQKAIRDVMVFLQSVGVSPTFAQKIFKTYGPQSIAQVKENPYHLAKDIIGIGFKTADGLAKKLGIASDASQRIDSGIEYVLSELSNDGHVCFPVADFLTEAQLILEVGADLIENRLKALASEDRIELMPLFHEGKQHEFIWLKALFVSETGIAREILRLRSAPSHLRNIDCEKAIIWVQSHLGLNLAENQKKAVAGSSENKIHIITGGPGTGKSTITKAILAIAGKLTSRILLAAPTGRAAKRMSEITKHKASTIHSLLEFDFSRRGFKRNRENPLDCDLIIIDESSMIDTPLMYSLLKAIPNHARAIFVGDINQLPSVGPGNVLKDIINSGTVSVTTLVDIYRQAADSRIITNAHRINKGVFPDIANQAESDFFFLDNDDPESLLKDILALVVQRLPKKYGYNPINDIQVLAPMKRGVIGTDNLNAAIQSMINPKGEPLFRAGQKYLPGDKVMQLRNNYKKEVFNGDIGTILQIDAIEQQLEVQFDDKAVLYDFTDLDELTLAYAVSVHKYQGSECPCIIMPVHTTHFKLLNRNLLYTGVTRGKKLVVLLGSKKALAMAVRNDEVKKRYTGLQQALMDMHISRYSGLR